MASERSVVILRREISDFTFKEHQIGNLRAEQTYARRTNQIYTVSPVYFFDCIFMIF